MAIKERPVTCTTPPQNLIQHSLVNNSVDSLKFQAAAAYQLPLLHKEGCSHDRSESKDNLLVVSPYTSNSHLFDLSSVSKSNQILAKALTVLKPIREDYATAPYNDSFNWAYVLDVVRQLSNAEGFYWTQEPETFYIVVFRSQVPPTTDRSHLAALDEKAHEEAMETGGLLKYWFGVPDENGSNLATCVWRYRSDAIKGSQGEGHRRAMMATRGLYSFWKVDRLQLVIKDGASAWDIIPWQY